jgi:protein-export membrane protein SecD
MLQFSKWKIIAVGLICLLGLLAAIPNFMSQSRLDSLPDVMPKNQLKLGLDLRGGAHLLLEMDGNDLRKDWQTTIRGDVRKQLRDAKIGFKAIGATPAGVQIRLVKSEERDKAVTELKKLVQPIGNVLLGNSTDDIEVMTGTEPDVIIVRPTEQGFQERLSQASGASIETVRRRVDAMGTTEPNIVRQGVDRILVQVPGLDDTKQLKALIGQTAKLTFHEVHPTISAEEARQTRVPLGFKIYDFADEEEGADILLREIPIVQGDDLVDAQPGFDQRTNEPIISFRFNQSGARRFGAFTQDHVQQPFAIVLDKKVLSAPVIREPILGGSGQISGNFTVDATNDLAIQLRSGALPTQLTIVEERTVGPSLGSDSIAAGRVAGIIGLSAVSVFMVLAYGLFGVFAVLAVLINLILIVGVMSTLGATLTLPGIAGLVLTVGMAVDANVLIFERIREELRNGKTSIAAIEGGFSKAFATILDSNLTTLIAAVVMFWLGSGPVRGFAVTLSLGIFATVFTAFTVTRLLVWYWVSRQKTKRVPAPL